MKHLFLLVLVSLTGCASLETADGYNEKGMFYKKRGDFKTAEEAYAKAIEKNPTHRDAYYNRGVLRYDNGKYRDAIEDFTMSLKVNPVDADAFYRRGSAFIDLDQYDKAIEDLQKSIEIRPSARAYGNLGFCYSKIKKYDLGLKSYSSAILMDPKKPLYFEKRGYIYEQLKKENLAQEDYENALKLRAGK